MESGLLHLSSGLCHSDRYSQVLTYHNLGLLAEAQEDYVEARANLQKALEIYVEYKDEYWAGVVRKYWSDYQTILKIGINAGQIRQLSEGI